MNSILTLLANLVFSTITFASGTMTIEGKIYARTESTISVQSHNQIYVIKSLDLGPEQNRILRARKSGEGVTLNVPMTAITDVTSIKTGK